MSFFIKFEQTDFHVVAMDVVLQKMIVLHQVEDGVKARILIKQRAGVSILKRLVLMELTKVMDISKSYAYKFL